MSIEQDKVQSHLSMKKFYDVEARYIKKDPIGKSIHDKHNLGMYFSMSHHGIACLDYMQTIMKITSLCIPQLDPDMI